jgi:hypothetical protein
MLIRNAAIQIDLAGQHAAYMPVLECGSRTGGKKTDALLEYNNQGD